MKRIAWFTLGWLMLVQSNVYANNVQDQALLKSASSTFLAPNSYVSVTGKKLPTRLWALANKDSFKENPDWKLVENGTISYESRNLRVLKIEFKFDQPVSNMYMFYLTAFAGCIGSYVMPEKNYEAFALGLASSMQSNPPGSDTSTKFDFYVAGLNSGDDINSLGSSEAIKWIVPPGKPDMNSLKGVSANMASVCPKTVDPTYVTAVRSPPPQPGPLSIVLSALADKVQDQGLSVPLAPNTLASVRGKKLPTRLWALANEESFKNASGWDALKNGTIIYESPTSRILKIEFRFDKPISSKSTLALAFFAGCIGSYVAPQKDYEAFVMGVPKFVQPGLSWSEANSKIDWYTMGLNSGDDIDALIRSEPISWGNLGGKVDFNTLKTMSTNRARGCLDIVNPIYLNADRVVRRN